MGTQQPSGPADNRQTGLESGHAAAGVAHEFNNFLTSILGYVSMLEAEASLSPEGRRGLAQIRRAVQRASELTRRLVTLGPARPSRPHISGPTALWAPGEMIGDETILLVEDDDDVRQLSCRVLEQQGYTVLAAPDAEAAVALADRHPGHIHLLLTDVVLPRLSGRELVARISIHRPATKVLYISGSTDGVITRHRMLEPGTEFLEKPFSLDHLLRAVRQVLGPPKQPTTPLPAD